MQHNIEKLGVTLGRGLAGIANTDIFSAHSTRGASTSVVVYGGASLQEVLSEADCSSSNTFQTTAIFCFSPAVLNKTAISLSKNI